MCLEEYVLILVVESRKHMMENVGEFIADIVKGPVTANMHMHLE